MHHSQLLLSTRATTTTSPAFFVPCRGVWECGPDSHPLTPGRPLLSSRDALDRGPHLANPPRLHISPPYPTAPSDMIFSIHTISRFYENNLRTGPAKPLLYYYFMADHHLPFLPHADLYLVTTSFWNTSTIPCAAFRCRLAPSALARDLSLPHTAAPNSAAALCSVGGERPSKSGWRVGAEGHTRTHTTRARPLEPDPARHLWTRHQNSSTAHGVGPGRASSSSSSSNSYIPHLTYLLCAGAQEHDGRELIAWQGGGRDERLLILSPLRNPPSLSLSASRACVILLREGENMPRERERREERRRERRSDRLAYRTRRR